MRRAEGRFKRINKRLETVPPILMHQGMPSFVIHNRQSVSTDGHLKASKHYSTASVWPLRPTLIIFTTLSSRPKWTRTSFSSFSTTLPASCFRWIT